MAYMVKYYVCTMYQNRVYKYMNLVSLNPFYMADKDASLVLPLSPGRQDSCTHFVENGMFLQGMGYVYLQYTHMFYVCDNKWVD